MKKNDVFTFTAPNGVEVVGVVINADWDDIHARNVYLCYAQNRLFTATTFNQWADKMGQKVRVESSVDVKEVLVDYAVLPDYDNMLELHQAMDYPTWEQNMEKPDPDESEDIFWDSCAEEHNKQEDV